MGRKKRKTTTEEDPEPVVEDTPPMVAKEASASEDSKAPASSGYAMTSHSGEIVGEDIYVSEGSDEEEESQSNSFEITLAGSKLGLMRRGGHHPMLMQPNRQWSRKETENANEGGGDETDKRDAEIEDETPAQRAARLLVEKQKKLEEAKEAARRLESEENAGRDACLFSKRTAFDIRFDQIEDKPWERGHGDMTDFFNYGLTEEDWLQYAEQQLMIRQELTDASRQKRQPDPNIVPVTPRAPKTQNPRVAVSGDAGVGDGSVKDEDGEEAGPAVGPELANSDDKSNANGAQKEAFVDVDVGEGGAWSAGAQSDPVLAQLIREQERQSQHHNDNEVQSVGVASSRGDDHSSYYGRDDRSRGHWDQERRSSDGYQGRDDWSEKEGGDYDRSSRSDRDHKYHSSRGGSRHRDYDSRDRGSSRSYHSSSYSRKRGRDNYEDRYRR